MIDLPIRVELARELSAGGAYFIAAPLAHERCKVFGDEHFAELLNHGI